MVQPASAVMVNRAGSTERTLSRREVESSTEGLSLVGTDPPDSDVCPPWVTTATPARALARTTACTSATVPGLAMRIGVPE